MDQSSTYQITLYTVDGEHVGDTFHLRDLPTPGLQFEIPKQRWRVTDVNVIVPKSPNWDAHATDVECTVVEAAHWDETEERWRPTPV